MAVVFRETVLPKRSPRNPKTPSTVSGPRREQQPDRCRRLPSLRRILPLFIVDRDTPGVNERYFFWAEGP